MQKKKKERFDAVLDKKVDIIAAAEKSRDAHLAMAQEYQEWIDKRKESRSNGE
jgi:hypothetical protein